MSSAQVLYLLPVSLFGNGGVGGRAPRDVERDRRRGRTRTEAAGPAARRAPPRGVPRRAVGGRVRGDRARDRRAAVPDRAVQRRDTDVVWIILAGIGTRSVRRNQSRLLGSDILRARRSDAPAARGARPRGDHRCPGLGIRAAAARCFRLQRRVGRVRPHGERRVRRVDRVPLLGRWLARRIGPVPVAGPPRPRRARPPRWPPVPSGTAPARSPPRWAPRPGSPPRPRSARSASPTSPS